jgi:uncharacterized protein (DUF305 family)
MNTYETKPKSGRSRLEAFFNAFLESIETEIEKSNEMAEQWKSEAQYWQEVAAKNAMEKERQMNLLRNVLMADQAGCKV